MLDRLLIALCCALGVLETTWCQIFDKEDPMKLIDVLKITEPATAVEIYGSNLSPICRVQAQKLLAGTGLKLDQDIIGINPGDHALFIAIDY